MNELENMIVMLEEELEMFRRRANPNDNYEHKIHRMLYTLAKSIQELKAPPQERKELDGTN